MPSRGVRLSVCASVTFVSCAKTNEDIFEIFSPFWFFHTKRGGDILTGTPLTEASNVRGYEKLRKLTILDKYLALSQKRVANQVCSWLE